MTDNRNLEEISWDELEQVVEQFIAADGPNTDELAADDFFALWTQFDGEAVHHVRSGCCG